MASSKTQHLEKAASKINEKPTTTIDFTQHQLDDGEWISTQERVIKDVSRLSCC
jgi:serine/threonine-protein phosphatase 2B catalytic subunit